MKNIRTLFILLMISILLFCLIACGGKSDNQTESPDTVLSTASEVPSEMTAEIATDTMKREEETSEPQYTKEENELEIMTIPQSENQENENPVVTESPITPYPDTPVESPADDATESVEDKDEGVRIELPFVPAQ